MKKILQILLFIIVLLSCTNKTTNNDIKSTQINYIKSVFCKNQLDLITSNDSIPIIKLDLNKSFESCLIQIENSFDYDICDKKVYFSIPFDLKTKKIAQTKNSILLKIRLYKHCECYCGDGLRMIFVLMNKRGQVLVNNNLILLDSLSKLDSIIPFYYLHDKVPLYEYPKSSFIALLWDEDVDSNKLSSVIFNVVRGYLKTANEFSEIRFNKSICQLTKKELIIVKDSLPFELEFFNHGVEKIPPPEVKK